MEKVVSNTQTRGIDLSAIDLSGNKVTVGFKCDPKVKLQLAGAAIDIGLTLSEYMENLVLDYQTAKEVIAKEKDELKKQIAFYENDVLQSFYDQYRGQTIDFTAADGSAMQVEVKDPRDIYTLLIHSFKIQK